MLQVRLLLLLLLLRRSIEIRPVSSSKSELFCRDASCLATEWFTITHADRDLVMVPVCPVSRPSGCPAVGQRTAARPLRGPSADPLVGAARICRRLAGVPYASSSSCHQWTVIAVRQLLLSFDGVLLVNPSLRRSQKFAESAHAGRRSPVIGASGSRRREKMMKKRLDSFTASV